MKFATFTLTIAAAIVALPAEAVTITGVIDAAPGAVGLSGTFTHVGANDTKAFNIGTTLAALAANPFTGRFTATTLAYHGVDESTIKSFLGADAASYVGPSATGDLADGILELKGYINVTLARDDHVRDHSR